MCCRALLPARLLLLALAMITAGCLTAGCAQGANIKDALASGTASASPGDSSPSPSRPAFSPARTPSPRPTATEQHTVTAPAAPSPAAPSPASTQATGGTASSLLWLWILLGALLLILIVAIPLTRRSRRRSARTASWRSQAADASARGSAVYDAISLAGMQETWNSPDAQARWVDIQRRADDLTQLLYWLQDNAPTEEDRVRVADVLASLQAVRGAMEATRTPGGASAQQGAWMQSSLESFGVSLGGLRSPDGYGF